MSRLGVNMSVLPDESLNRILGWIERGVKTQAERREQRELYKTLSNEYAIATQRGHSWLSLWLLGLRPKVGSRQTLAPGRRRGHFCHLAFDPAADHVHHVAD